jgi:hypothetical protein
VYEDIRYRFMSTHRHASSLSLRMRVLAILERYRPVDIPNYFDDGTLRARPAAMRLSVGLGPSRPQIS